MEHPRQAFFETIDHDAARTMGPLVGHRAQQVMKLALDGRQIIKNVGMIEFEIVEHDGARSIVDKLASLVKKSRVIFVGLDDESLAVTQSGRNPKVQRYPTHQKSGLKTGLVQNPG